MLGKALACSQTELDRAMQNLVDTELPPGTPPFVGFGAASRLCASVLGLRFSSSTIRDCWPRPAGTLRAGNRVLLPSAWVLAEAQRRATDPGHRVQRIPTRPMGEEARA